LLYEAAWKDVFMKQEPNPLFDLTGNVVSLKQDQPKTFLEKNVCPSEDSKDFVPAGLLSVY
jgi:hypothetical protein